MACAECGEPDLQGQFDVVFTGVVMPGGNGIELGRRIHVRWPALPVVLTSRYISGRGHPARVSRARQALFG